MEKKNIFNLKNIFFFLNNLLNFIDLDLFNFL